MRVRVGDVVDRPLIDVHVGLHAPEEVPGRHADWGAAGDAVDTPLGGVQEGAVSRIGVEVRVGVLPVVDRPLVDADAGFAPPIAAQLLM